MEGCFQFALRAWSGGRAVMKETVGQRPAELFVEEHEQERGPGSFVAEPVGVAVAVAFDQAVGFHFAQIVAELIEPITILGETEGGEVAWWMSLAGSAAYGVGRHAPQAHFRRSAQRSCGWGNDA